MNLCGWDVLSDGPPLGIIPPWCFTCWSVVIEGAFATRYSSGIRQHLSDEAPFFEMITSSEQVPPFLQSRSQAEESAARVRTMRRGLIAMLVLLQLLQMVFFIRRECQIRQARQTLLLDELVWANTNCCVDTSTCADVEHQWDQHTKLRDTFSLCRLWNSAFYESSNFQVELGGRFSDNHSAWGDEQRWSALFRFTKEL